MEEPKGGWLSSNHAVEYILAYFSGKSIIKALCEELGKEEVLDIIAKEC